MHILAYKMHARQGPLIAKSDVAVFINLVGARICHRLCNNADGIRSYLFGKVKCIIRSDVNILCARRD